MNLRGPKQITAEITLCDVDASELCVVTFGTDSPDSMIITFQLPDADYPLFYVKASNRGIANTYPCTVVTDMPTGVNCSGARTRLGEYIDIEVYTIEGDTLIAQGRFIITALMRATAVNSTQTTAIPSQSTSTPAVVPSPLTPVTSTPTPGTAYPNP